MKKALAIILSILLLFTACSSGSGEVLTGGKRPASDGTAKSVKSSVFGRSVKYDAVAAAEGLALPTAASEIADMAQAEETLYFLADGAVYSLGIISGESVRLFETEAEMFAVHGGEIFTYSPESSVLSEYDASGSLINELALEIEGVNSVEGLSVTDDYYVFVCTVPGTMMMEPHLFVYSRSGGEFILSKKTAVTRVFPYKGNKVLTVTVGTVFPSVDINVFDAETGKSETLRQLGSESEFGDRPAAVYRPKTDTVLVFGAGAGNEGDVPVCITEFSLDDTDKMLLNRYYFGVTYGTKFFLGAYENIVAAISTSDGGIRVYDCLNPPESISILCHHINGDEVIYGFEKETGILVTETYTDYDKLAVKLMAGDDDFDIFSPGSNYHNYVDAGVCADLKEVESLGEKIYGNAAAALVASYDGKYFGVPIGISNYLTEENYPEDGSGVSYSLVVSENLYLAKNVDISEARYSDPSGDELYKLFKYLNDNPTGNRKKMPFGEEVTILGTNVYMLNQKSQNRDSALKFLEYLFDAYSGNIPGLVPEGELYPTLESAENCYAEWRCRPIELISPIFNARNEILGKNGEMSASELKKLAKDAAAEVAMRIGE